MSNNRIMIVEDEKIVAADIRMSVKKMGYAVCATASSGLEAIQKAESTRPDLILMDINLKGNMDGIEAATRIKDLYHIPVVYLTSFGEDAVLQRAKAAEPYGYITKPFVDRDLYIAIEISIYKKQAEEALQESEKRLSSIFNTVGDIIFMLDVEQDGQFRFDSVNPSFLLTTGLPAEAVVGKRVTEVIPEPSLSIVLGKYRQVIQEKTIIRWEETSDYPTGKLTGLVSVAPILNTEGTCTHLVGTVRDITERKRAEVALQQRTLELSERVKELNCLYGIAHLVEKSGHSLEDVMRGTVELIPPSWQYTEITCARIIFKGHEFKTGNFAESAWKQISDIIVYGEAVGNLEVYYLAERPACDEGPFLKEERNLIDAITERLGRIIEHKRAEEMLRITHDDLERKVRERTAELQEKQAQLIHTARLASLGEMSTGVAHELNQPLSLIRLCAESVKFNLRNLDRDGIGEKIKENLDRIIRSVDRAANIIIQMRNFARASGAVSNRIDPTIPVENSLIFFKEQFRQHEISLSLDYGENLPRVYLDSQKLEQVIVNLLSNARFAVDKRGENETAEYRKDIRISVLLDEFDESLIIEVADNGIGMTPNEKDQCITPFFTTKEVGEGTGLGLSICHGIIREFGGALEIESEEGSGTKIRVFIPVGEKNINA